jgi:hypothetical protein
MTEADLIAQFLAKKGATKIATGARTIDEKVFKRNRGDRLLKLLKPKTEDDLINERLIVGEHVRNGLGEWIA